MMRWFPRWLFGLLSMGAAVIVAFVVTAVLTSTPPSGVMSTDPHELLEADRVMTQQMAIAAGPGMDAQMFGSGMLRRSADLLYVRALEEHMRAMDRMLGRVP